MGEGGWGLKKVDRQLATHLKGFPVIVDLDRVFRGAIFHKTPS